jgi:hypothetical protein
VSRKASRGRQRAEDKERLRERVLVDGKGDNFLSGGGWAAPLYIHATVDGLTRDHLLANTYQATTPTNLDTPLWLSCSAGHTEM